MAGNKNMIKQPNMDLSKYKIDDETLNSYSTDDNSQLSIEETLKKVSNYISYLESKKDDLQTFKNKDYQKEALAICPSWLWKEARKEDLSYFRGLTSFDEKEKTIIIKIFDTENNLISYKRRRLGNAKWRTAKGTHPNKTTIRRIKDKYNPTYIIEGHRDALTAILLGINFIAVPTVAYTQFTDQELKLLQDRDIVFLPDLGDQGKSINSMTALSLQSEKVSKSISLVNLISFARSSGMGFSSVKADLSDIIELWSEGLDAFTSKLHYYSQKENAF